MKKTYAQRETLTIADFAPDGTRWYGIDVGWRKGDDLVYARSSRARMIWLRVDSVIPST